MEWKHPLALALLAIPLGLAILSRRLRARRRALALPSPGAFRLAGRSVRARLVGLPFLLRLVALTAMVIAIARPRTGQRFDEVVTRGVDIVIALDVSGSMRAEDFRPHNRLHVAREVVQRFVDSRRSDRVGLVVFAGKAYTQCPLTVDYRLLKRFVDEISFDSVDAEGTAIGMALMTALNRLRESPSTSRIVVLVTDGMNNRGAIDPMTATRAAQAVDVRVYTVGVGTSGLVPFPAQGGYDYAEVPLDEATLQAIADDTGGYYFRATDAKSFDEALRRIGELETTDVVTRAHVLYDEMFAPILGLTLALVVLEALLASTWLRRLP